LNWRQNVQTRFLKGVHPNFFKNFAASSRPWSIEYMKIKKVWKNVVFSHQIVKKLERDV